MSRAFINVPGDWGSIPGRVIPKTHKMVHDASFLNHQRNKLRIKSKVEKSSERSGLLPYTLMLKLLKREPSGSLPGRVIPKTQKWVLDDSLLNTQNNKSRIKGKVE